MTGSALAVDAELVVERDGRRFAVWSEGDRLVVEAPSLTALRSLGTLRDALPLGQFAPGDRLVDAGLTVDVQVRRSTVARAGAGVTGDRIGRRLSGLDAEVDWVGVAKAAVRSLG